MLRKKSDRLRDVGFIPGIYNFCDHWCEKCPLKQRCLNYVLEQKIDEKTDRNPFEEKVDKGVGSWEFLKGFFDSTKEVMEELSRERGLRLKDLFPGEEIENIWEDDQSFVLDDTDLLDGEIGDTDVIKICLIYQELAEEGLDMVFGILDEKNWKAGSRKEIETESALDEINWYLDLLQPKIRLAFTECRGYSHLKNAVDEAYNGTAKVVLISIEKSAHAWEVLKKYCPGNLKNISHIQVVLEELKKEVENSFPKALAFKRPGFDD